MVHELKCKAPYFGEIVAGWKRYEIRLNDRNYQVGDAIILKEFADGKYTGRETARKIIHMTDWPEGLKPGYVVLGIS